MLLKTLNPNGVNQIGYGKPRDRLVPGLQSTFVAATIAISIKEDTRFLWSIGFLVNLMKILSNCADRSCLPRLMSHSIAVAAGMLRRANCNGHAVIARKIPIIQRSTVKDGAGEYLLRDPCMRQTYYPVGQQMRYALIEPAELVIQPVREAMIRKSKITAPRNFFQCQMMMRSSSLINRAKFGFQLNQEKN